MKNLWFVVFNYETELFKKRRDNTRATKWICVGYFWEIKKLLLTNKKEETEMRDKRFWILFLKM